MSARKGSQLCRVVDAVHEALFASDDDSDPDSPIPYVTTDNAGVKPGHRVTIAVYWSHFNGQTMTVESVHERHIMARSDADERPMRFDHGTYVVSAKETA